MALAGPRLDRPSAVGDEGRPRAASLWLASAVVVGLVGGAGLAIGQPGLLPSLGFVVGLVIAGVGLVQRERFGLVFVGYVLVVVFGGITLLQLSVLLVYGQFGLAVVGLAVALLGVGLAWADVPASDGFYHVGVGVAIAYVTMLLALLVAALVVALFAGGGRILAATTAGVSPATSLAWFAFAVGFAAGGLRLAVWRLPTEQLVSHDRRPAVEAWLHPVARGLLVTALLTPVALVGLMVLEALGVFDTLATVAPAVARLLDALGAPALVGVLVALGTVGLLAGVLATVTRLATKGFDAVTVRRLAAAAAGVGLAVLLLLTAGAVAAIPTRGNVVNLLTVVGAVLAVPPLLVLVSLTGLLCVSLGLVPDRAGAPAVAAAGLVVATVGFGRGPPLLVFGCIAGAAVVWDVSWFGLGLTAELGHVPETRRLELFHGVLAVGTGAVAVAALLALEVVRTALGVGGTAAMLLACFGALLLLTALRG